MAEEEDDVVWFTVVVSMMDASWKSSYKADKAWTCLEVSLNQYESWHSSRSARMSTFYLLQGPPTSYAANIFNPRYGISSGKKPIQLPASPRHRPPTISVKILPSIPNAVHYRYSQPPFDGMSVHHRPVRSSLDRIFIPLLARLYLPRQGTSLEVP